MNMPSKKVIIIYIILVLLLVLLPINGKDSKVNHTFILALRLDYIFHGLMFFPWMGFLLINPKLMKPVFWLIIGLLFAVITESLQFFISYRTFNINDVIANMLGVLIGLGLLFFDQKRQVVS